MKKIIAALNKQEITTKKRNYDGNQEEIRAIYQDCIDEMRTAKWDNIGYNPFTACERTERCTKDLIEFGQIIHFPNHNSSQKVRHGMTKIPSFINRFAGDIEMTSAFFIGYSSHNATRPLISEISTCEEDLISMATSILPIIRSTSKSVLVRQ